MKNAHTPPNHKGDLADDANKKNNLIEETQAHDL